MPFWVSAPSERPVSGHCEPSPSPAPGQSLAIANRRPATLWPLRASSFSVDMASTGQSAAAADVVGQAAAAVGQSPPPPQSPKFGQSEAAAPALVEPAGQSSSSGTFDGPGHALALLETSKAPAGGGQAAAGQGSGQVRSDAGQSGGQLVPVAAAAYDVRLREGARGGQSGQSARARSKSPMHAWLGGIPPAGRGTQALAVGAQPLAPPPRRTRSPAPPPMRAAPCLGQARGSVGQDESNPTAKPKTPPPVYSPSPATPPKGPPQVDRTRPRTPSAPPPVDRAVGQELQDTPPGARAAARASSVGRSPSPTAAGRRSRSVGPRPRHAVSAAELFGEHAGQAQAGQFGQAGPPKAAQPAPAAPPSPPSDLVLPGSPDWNARLHGAGAPQAGQSFDLVHFETQLTNRAVRLVGQVNHPGSALSATSTDALVSGRMLYVLRDHIAQTQRELSQLDTMLMTAFFGQISCPPLRRGLNLVIQTVRPFLKDIICFS